jgi:hypothetical protein
MKIPLASYDAVSWSVTARFGEFLWRQSASSRVLRRSGVSRRVPLASGKGRGPDGCLGGGACALRGARAPLLVPPVLGPRPSLYFQHVPGGFATLGPHPAGTAAGFDLSRG